jgi:TRAP-type C4-dicarboxylate transport system permease small subunit
MNRINSIVFILSKAFMYISSIILILMMFHIFLDVLFKYFFNSPLIGTLETVAYYYMVAVVFLPLALVEFRNEHIHVDMFYQMMSSPFKKIIYIFSSLISALYFSILSYQTFIDAIGAFEIRETVMANFNMYIWPSRWVLPLSLGLIALATLLHAYKAITNQISFTAEQEVHGE